MKNLSFFDALGIGFAWAGAGGILYLTKGNNIDSADLGLIAIACIIGASYVSKLVVLKKGFW